jgi:hypothetical protein
MTSFLYLYGAVRSSMFAARKFQWKKRFKFRLLQRLPFGDESFRSFQLQQDFYCQPSLTPAEKSSATSREPGSASQPRAAAEGRLLLRPSHRSNDSETPQMASRRHLGKSQLCCISMAPRSLERRKLMQLGLTLQTLMGRGFPRWMETHPGGGTTPGGWDSVWGRGFACCTDPRGSGLRSVGGTTA